MIEIPKPNYYEKTLITPQQSIRMKAKKNNVKFKDWKVPRIILLSLSVGATQTLIKEINAKEVNWIYTNRPLFVGNISGKKVGAIWAAPGAPLATMVMEDLIACGAELLIGVGLLGAIQPRINVGDIIIPTFAVRDEGTSYHYIPRDIKAFSNKEITLALKKSCEEFKITYNSGPIWTTDALYRETRSKIKYFQRIGILGVDMESSAIFSIGIYHKIKVACILIASTNLIQQRPTIGFYSENLKNVMIKVVRISKLAIKHLIF